jgi:ribonuclease P protein component
MSQKIHINQRLKSEKQIRLLFENGSSFFVYPVKFQYVLQSETPDNSYPFCFGVSVSKKNFKKAVERNSLKRRMREAIRLQKTEIEMQLHTHNKSLTGMFIFVGKTELSFDQIKKAVSLLLKKAQKKISAGAENKDSDSDT